MNWNDRKGSQLRLRIRSSDYYDHPIFMAFMHLYTVYHTHVTSTWPHVTIMRYKHSERKYFSRKVWFWCVQKWFSTHFRQSWAFWIKKHFSIKQLKIEVIRGLSLIISWWLCTLCHVKIELIKIYPTIRTIKIPWFFHFFIFSSWRLPDLSLLSHQSSILLGTCVPHCIRGHMAKMRWREYWIKMCIF